MWKYPVNNEITSQLIASNTKMFTIVHGGARHYGGHHLISEGYVMFCLIQNSYFEFLFLFWVFIPILSFYSYFEFLFLFWVFISILSFYSYFEFLFLFWVFIPILSFYFYCSMKNQFETAIVDILYLHSILSLFFILLLQNIVKFPRPNLGTVHINCTDRDYTSIVQIIIKLQLYRFNLNNPHLDSI